MKEIESLASKLRSLGWYVSVHSDIEKRYLCGRRVSRRVYRVAVHKDDPDILSWDVQVFEFPWAAIDWLNDIISSVA